MTSRLLTQLRPLALIAILLAGPVATALAYWPGFMTWDSIRQYDQATSGDFDDWHPPVMEWIWRQLTAIHTGPAPMMILQLSLIWGGLAMLALWALRRGRPGLAFAIAACGFMPFGLALSGEVLKDCLMAGTLLVAGGTIAWKTEASEWRVRVALTVLGFACLLFASMLRFNAFLATVPLCIALLPYRASSTFPRLIMTSLLASALMLAALPTANRLIGAKDSGVTLSLIIFDLGGITEYSGDYVFPPLGLADPIAVNDDCYEPAAWDSYAWWAETICKINFDNVRAAFKKSGVSPTRFWLKAVITHPIAYLEHRLGHFNVHTRFLARNVDERPVQIDPPENTWGYTITPSPLLTALDDAAVWSGTTPLGWPIIWIALALGATIMSLDRLPSRRIALPLSLSALLYGLGYFVFSVASELRYHFWTMLAAAVATMIIGSDLIQGARVARSRLLLAALAPVATLVLSVGWRLLSPE